MRQITLIYNSSAGQGAAGQGSASWEAEQGAGGQTLSSLCALVHDHGFKAVCIRSDAPDLADALLSPADLLVAAGGDGTLSDVMRALPSADEGPLPPLTVLPLGTVNNVAESLGICGPLEALVAGWRDGQTRRLDVGRAATLGGDLLFLEGIGLGALAQAMMQTDQVHPPKAEQSARSRAAFAELLAVPPAAPLPPVKVDGEPLPEDLMLVEVLNIGRVGPALWLAPQANPGDGVLDVAFVTTQDAPALRAWLGEHSLEDRDAKPPSVRVMQGRRVEIGNGAMALRIDDTFPDRPEDTTPLEASLAAAGVLILVPKRPTF